MDFGCNDDLLDGVTDVGAYWGFVTFFGHGNFVLKFSVYMLHLSYPGAFRHAFCIYYRLYRWPRMFVTAIALFGATYKCDKMRDMHAVILLSKRAMAYPGCVTIPMRFFPSQ